MATAVVVNVGPVRTASRGSTKPRKLFRGVTRTLIRKTLAKINSIINADNRAFSRGLTLGFDAALVAGAENSADGRAFFRVQARLVACLAAKEGDE